MKTTLLIVTALLLTTACADAAKIKERAVRWDTNPIATSQLVYVRQAGTPFSYDAFMVEVPMPTARYVLPGAFSMAVDGNYTVSIVAVDSVGNLSDQVDVTSFFDFTPPVAVTNVRVE